ncbi:aspartyl-phosphate phosphatase Spo0E family protein [Bacillus horti]|uniref:Aspartyl-phosphate phosphatase Spo0E family protein n=1 Tax=Caldalkalibacillus horti TaxID=77523 RepID=A0ABT9VZR9_9BACI|nr:aspartyl-phosphate phosphatase Spo0E family protein [Bacillus horti]MDQ0166355.1 hypothetical protein [Bacillus horti]
MVHKLDSLYAEVEIKRYVLHEKVKVYQDFSHPDIVEISQELDILLNEINELERQK